MKSNNFFSKFFFPKIFLNFFFEKKYEKKNFKKEFSKKIFQFFFFEKKISKKKFPLKIIFPDIFPGKTFKIFYLPKRPFSDLVFFHFFAWLYIHSTVSWCYPNYKHALLLFLDGVRTKRRSGKIMVSKLLWSKLSRFQKFVFKISIIF